MKIGALTAGGFAGGLVVFSLVAWLVLKLFAPLRGFTGKLGISWRFAIAAVQRRPVATIIQLVSLAVGLMALLLLTVTRTDLVDAWRKAAPPDAPNRFVINIQPDQASAVGAQLSAAGVDAPLHPMIRGRLIEVNGKKIGPESFTGDRAQRSGGSRVQLVVHGRRAVAQSHHRGPLVHRRQQRVVDRRRHRARLSASSSATR